MRFLWCYLPITLCALAGAYTRYLYLEDQLMCLSANLNFYLEGCLGLSSRQIDLLMQVWLIQSCLSPSPQFELYQQKSTGGHLSVFQAAPHSWCFLCVDKQANLFYDLSHIQSDHIPRRRSLLGSRKPLLNSQLKSQDRL